MRIIFLLVIVSIKFCCISQEKGGDISKVAEIEKELIGKSLKTAVKKLGLDTNHRVIFEPPGKCRGIKSSEINGWQVQLFIERTSTGRGFRTEGVYDEIKNKKIIGLSWMSPNDCNSVGEVIWYFAYDQYGPCDE
tara:strand:- start:135 stop:539 length:405 start_codon:yes stop_codon:yes gene_type:complete